MKLKLAALFVLFTTGLFAQNKPFWNEIQQFRKSDSVSMPAPNGIVFVGSSSLRMWTDLESVYKDYQAINRGFGGSTLQQANMYIDDLVLKYKPRQVVIYSGENDIAEGATGEETYERFVTFYENLRAGLPKAHILYVSMKLSPSRTKFADEMIKGNDMIKAYLKKQKNAKYVDINPAMKDKAGNLRPELFKSDMLHMQQAGYDIWIKEITPYLKKK
ncbi:GDSL-type esterase/lipase family protein [Pedobacter faecalis]|uniref:GDSL-type esterase/lipase family protein n=1 Tax=Pedobacter faecalis TaxID=3041495 RepID=UPI00254D24F8|nr:GDSL-type esterase/lipase family protein [Pedobacter sp. ELA7]